MPSDMSSMLLPSTIESATPTADMLRASEAAQASLRGRMIAQQEELDWEVYPSYGLLDDALTYAGQPPEVKLGERAFEIVLARKVAAGEEDTVWFERHGSTPITAIPARWPEDYHQIVARRIVLIETDRNLALIELFDFFSASIAETIRATSGGDLPEPDMAAHMAIVDAIETGDPDQADVAVRRFMAPVFAFLDERLEA